jgi:hypothetical protein
LLPEVYPHLFLILGDERDVRHIINQLSWK